MNTVQDTLEVLHNDAKKDYMRVGKGVVKSIFRPMQAADFEHAYLPITSEQGEAMRKIIIENKFKNVIEFGTSFGISTIYLADAVRQTGGKVISTELLESKAQKAIGNIADAGLSDYAEVKIGDAMQTLKAHTQAIDFLFLDGWKDLYLPLFKMLAPHFHSDTIIYADNMDMAGTRDYANYVLNETNGYTTQAVYHNKAFITKKRGDNEYIF